MKFAVIHNDIVTNLIVADSLEIAQEVTNTTCVEYDDNLLLSPGWAYDGINFVNLNPPIIPEPILNFPLPMD